MSVVQFLDEDVIAAIEAYYARRNFKQILRATDENSEESLTMCWQISTLQFCISDLDEFSIEFEYSTLVGRNIWPYTVH